MASYQHSLKQFTDLRAQGQANEALITFERQKGALYDKTLAELHTEKVTASEKLSALERILSSLRQQSHQLHEDIRTGEAFTKAFTMRASADAQDDDEVLEDDASRRDEAAEKLARRAVTSRAACRELGVKRTRDHLRREVESAERPHLREYAAAIGRVLSLVEQLREAQQDAAAERLPPLRPQLAPLAEKLRRAAQAHLAPTEGGAESLAHLAIGQIEDLSILPHAPPLLAFHYQKAMAAIAAEEEVEAAAAEGLGGGEEEQADADGAAEAEAATGAE